MKLSERIRSCMTTPWAEQGITGPKDKYTLQLIEEQLWVADEVAQLEANMKQLYASLIVFGATYFTDGYTNPPSFWKHSWPAIRKLIPLDHQSLEWAVAYNATLEE